MSDVEDKQIDNEESWRCGMCLEEDYAVMLRRFYSSSVMCGGHGGQQ